MVDEYISREEAKKTFRNGEHPVKWAIESGAKTLGDAFALILDEVPAADVREVVTCGECDWHVDCGYHYCNKWCQPCPDNAEFFCAYGKRRES